RIERSRRPVAADFITISQTLISGDRRTRIGSITLSAKPLSGLEGSGASHVRFVDWHMMEHGEHVKCEQAPVGRCIARKTCRRAPFVFLQFVSLPRTALATIRSSPLVVATMAGSVIGTDHNEIVLVGGQTPQRILFDWHLERFPAELNRDSQLCVSAR